MVKYVDDACDEVSKIAQSACDDVVKYCDKIIDTIGSWFGL